ncbi:alpha/beta fold hydrolase [Pedobacter cryoconitis]|uniref:Pimeloyl-ACP methyl ester carboxylesterase n=1 Tax=Pedobacter cryoconitis TaxID=188932 RepID=A0A7X0J7C8_9SPHI|nr:alpha/beta hydrolase [Pedobacter cryoconitis]MBB6501192.1 pimeloyl-ACP methyl ester carboxylesterase [Pedobacter cryoconitis]
MTEKKNLDTVELKHGMALIDSFLRIHYVEAGNGEQTIVLLHGFPQTWWEWRYIIPELVEAGFRVIVPDYRGAGDSWRPATGYDKRTMASDIHKLLKEQLKIQGPVIMAGHDIGLMVAYAYAQEYREDVSHLIVIDAPLPGTLAFDKIRSDHRVWHFAFHAVLDLPELLIAGREREYLQAFFNYRIFNVGAISKEDIDLFATAYSAPGAMRAGLEVYRAFNQDIIDNQMYLQKNGKLSIPVLAIGGEISTSGSLMKEMMEEVADHVVAARIPNTAHWVVEENPEGFLSEVLKFLF